MGVTATDLSLVLELRKKGFQPERIATIGRLSLYLHEHQLKRLKRLFPAEPALEVYRWGDPCESVLQAITGAREIISIDASNYEGASIVHDMNVPVDAALPELIGSCDLVIDGGTLEHVFNFPVAVNNLMSLSRVGGYLITANPANNICGHGFYQFSPELMHRLYSEVSGFSMEIILLTVCKAISVERDRYPRSYQVRDPKELKRRVIISNRDPVMIRALARKIRPGGLVIDSIQQSDYAAAWSSGSPKCEGSSWRKAQRSIFDRLPHRIQTSVLTWMSNASFRGSEVMNRWRGDIE